MVETMDKDRPTRINHFGLKVRESDPVKLITKAIALIGSLANKIFLAMGDME
jgi:hypothetical protein